MDALNAYEITARDADGTTAECELFDVAGWPYLLVTLCVSTEDVDLISVNVAPHVEDDTREAWGDERREIEDDAEFKREIARIVERVRLAALATRVRRS